MQSYRWIVPIRRWWWLFVAAGLLAATTSVISLQNIPSTYRATATIIIGQTLDNPNPSSGEFYLAQQLASIYSSLAMRDPVRDAARETLGLDALPEYSVRALSNNPLIEVSVTDVSPERAQAVANELARQITLQGPSSSEEAEQARASFVTEQLDFLQARIEETQSELADLQSQMASMVSASDLERAQQTQTTLQERLVTLQTNYASILTNSSTGAANILRIFEAARLPTRPIGPGRALIVAIAAVLGIILAAGGVYLVEYFDNRLRTPEAISAAFDLPVIGYVPVSQSLRGSSEENGFKVDIANTSQASLSFELLAMNLLFRFGDIPPQSLLVTSLRPGSGKTTVASHLAMQFARMGQRIVLVDADLRHPEIHRRFGMEMHPGLGDSLREALPLKGVIQKTEDARLQVVTAGAQEGDYSQIFHPPDIVRILAQLKDKIDLVIIDSPPVVATETLLMANKVESILLVIGSGEIDEQSGSILLDHLRQSEGNIIGLVVNRIPRFMIDSYGMKPYLAHARRVRKPKQGSDQDPAAQGEKSTQTPAFIEVEEDSE